MTYNQLYKFVLLQRTLIKTLKNQPHPVLLMNIENKYFKILKTCRGRVGKKLNNQTAHVY